MNGKKDESMYGENPVEFFMFHFAGCDIKEILIKTGFEDLERLNL